MASNLFVKTGDTVMVMSGEDKGKTGKIQKAFPSTGKIVVQGVAMVKKHQKPRGQGMQGGIIEQEAAIPACKVQIVCPKCKKPTRVGYTFSEGEGKASRRKRRVCAKCKAYLDD